MSVVRVGLLDSGIDPALAGHVDAARSFAGDDETTADAVGHGSRLARIVLAKAPAASLVIARIFGSRHTTSAAAAAAGLDWLVAEGADIVAMSFGLRDDRAVLRDACAAAAAAGSVLLAASPARGAPVFPASYPGVLRITGDARCDLDEVSQLGTVQADFGACVRAEENAAGASFAVAHAAGLLAAAGNPPDPVAYLTGIARYRGPERRSS